jgi:hypothetical protein
MLKNSESLRGNTGAEGRRASFLRDQGRTPTLRDVQNILIRIFRKWKDVWSPVASNIAIAPD